MTNLTTRALEAPLRIEDRRFVAGAGRYVGDIRIDGCLDAAFVRAGTGRGALRRVDAGAARSLDSVVGAWAASDLPDLPAVPPTKGETDTVWTAIRDRPKRRP